MIKQKTFLEYLTIHVAGGSSDDLLGDFAEDAVNDKYFPCGIMANKDGFIEVFNYLYFAKDVKMNVMVAFLEGWQRFFLTTTGRSWVEWADENMQF